MSYVAPIGLRSRKHIQDFVAHRPDSLEAVARLRREFPGAMPMAGGLDLINRLKLGEPVAHVIRLGGVPGLDGIEFRDGTLRLGALVTHAALARSETVAAALPDLAALWHAVANPRIRHVGTLGGNLLAGNVGYDAAPALLALGADAEWLLPDGACITLPLATPMPAGSVLLALRVPGGPDVALFADRSLRPVLSAYLGLQLNDGRVAAARLGLGGGWPAPVVVSVDAAVGLSPTQLGAGVAEIAATLDVPQPMTDGNASASYRRRMVTVLLRRLLTRAGARP